MEMFYVDDFLPVIEKNDVLEKLKMKPDHPYVGRVDDFLAETKKIAQPRAFYRIAPVEELAEDHVVVDGVVLTSKVLSANFAGRQYVYPYLCTCGRELVDYAESLTDIMDVFIVDAIMELYLLFTKIEMVGRLENSLDKGMTTSSVSPGSLVDWQIAEQKQLFQLYHGADATIGVSLTSSCLMQPIKSLSGILYVSDEDFRNCQLCQRAKCPTRQAEFDIKLYTQYFHHDA